MTALTDQIAVVTGASSGIGKAIALALAAQGARLCVVGRNREALEAVASQARAMAPRVLISPTDLTQDAHVERLALELQQEFGQVDVLVHSAGVYVRGTLQSAPVHDLDRQYRTNVRAPYLLTQVLLPMLKVRPGKSCLSIRLLACRPGRCSQYAATKHALNAIANSLREEVNADGIRVLSVFPGDAATPLQEIICQIEGRLYQPEILIQPEDIAAVVVNTLRLPRSAR